MKSRSEALPLLLLQAREVTLGYFKPSLQKVSITEPQWRVIRVLSDHEELESSVLADKCCISSPSLSGILNRMEKTGYIQRRKSDQDLRCVLVSLSPGGQEIFQQVRPMLDIYYAEISETFSEKKLELLSALLSELITSVGDRLNEREKDA